MREEMEKVSDRFFSKDSELANFVSSYRVLEERKYALMPEENAQIP